MTTLVLDTFTGSGTLATHAGETGATWLPVAMTNWDGDSNLSHALLDGSGLFYTTSISNNPGVYPSGSAGMSGDVVIEVDFIYTGAAGPYMGFFGGNSLNQSYVLNWVVGSSSVEIDAYYYPPTGAPTSLGFFTDGTIAPSVLHTLRIEVTGATKVLKIDGVQKLTFTDSSVSSGYFWMYLYDSLNFKVSRVMVSNSVTPMFWETLIKTTET